jgi:hypothetical protein
VPLKEKMTENKTNNIKTRKKKTIIKRKRGLYPDVLGLKEFIN